MSVSRWSKYKTEVIALRKSGVSLPNISRKYGIARSTLSYWFRDIELSDDKKQKIRLSAEERMAKSRLKAASWHRNQKQLRIIEAEQYAKNVCARLAKTPESLELALAMLYFGEGGKSNSTSMGAADPFMLEFFVVAVEKLYDHDRKNFRYYLHLRDDQDALQLKKYWSSKLNIPIEKIKYVSKDKRSVGKPTREGYMGVCQIRVPDIAISRRLTALYSVYCSEVIRGD